MDVCISYIYREVYVSLSNVALFKACVGKYVNCHRVVEYKKQKTFA